MLGDHLSVGVAVGDSVVRRRTKEAENPDDVYNSKNVRDSTVTQSQHEVSWKRVLLLIVAITIHNIPGQFNYNWRCLLETEPSPALQRVWLLVLVLVQLESHQEQQWRMPGV